MSTQKRSRTDILEHPRLLQSQKELERSPLLQPHEPMPASTPIDRFTLKVSAITATTNMADLICVPCVHTPIEKLIAKGAALAAIKDGKCKDHKILLFKS